MKTNDDSFFADSIDPRREARALATEAMCQLLIWMAEGKQFYLYVTQTIDQADGTRDNRSNQEIWRKADEK